jgi:hypothetical protein
MKLEKEDASAHGDDEKIIKVLTNSNNNKFALMSSRLGHFPRQKEGMKLKTLFI